MDCASFNLHPEYFERKEQETVGEGEENSLECRREIIKFSFSATSQFWSDDGEECG